MHNLKKKLKTCIEKIKLITANKQSQEVKTKQKLLQLVNDCKIKQNEAQQMIQKGTNWYKTDKISTFLKKIKKIAQTLEIIVKNSLKT